MSTKLDTVDCPAREFGCSCIDTCRIEPKEIPVRRTSWFAHFVTSLVFGLIVAVCAYIGLSRAEANYQAELRI